MYSLYQIGPEVERLFGGQRFLALYFLSGIAGNIASSLHSNVPGVGASGCICGLIGAYYIFVRQNRGILDARSVSSSLSNLHRTAAMNVLIGLTSPHIDNFAHVGGACCGALTSYVAGPRLGRGAFGGIVDNPRFSIAIPKLAVNNFFSNKRKSRKFFSAGKGAPR